MDLNELKGARVKADLKAKRVRRSYHNKHVNGSGNFGYVVVFEDGSNELTGERWLRIDGDYNPSGEVIRLRAGRYSEAGHRVEPPTYEGLIRTLRECGA